MAAVSLRALFMMGGAAYTGSFLYNNLDSTRAFAARLLQLSDTDDANNSTASTNNSTTVDALAKKLDSLTREFSRARDTPVVVMPAGTRGAGALATVSDALNLLGWAVVIVSVGGVGYYVAVKRNVKLRDLVWVSRGRFNETVAAMEQGIARMRGVVSAVKRELGERLRLLDGRVDHVKMLSEKIGVEVSEVKEGVDGLGDEMWKVKDAVEGVGDRMDLMDGKLDKTNDGIYALVKLVYAAMGGRPAQGAGLTELKRFMMEMEQGKGTDKMIEEMGENSMPPLQKSMSGRSKDVSGLLSLFGEDDQQASQGTAYQSTNSWPSLSMDGNKARTVKSSFS